ncbi:XK-related protein 6-like, partial [Sitodiplosis mosellana]
PQKILQISIILSGEEKISTPQMLSLCSSMFSMAWCIASYHRCIRLSQLDKINISWIGSIVQSSWHLTITVSRILSIAIVASLFPKLTLLCFSIHAILMGLWVFIFDRSPFCSNSLIHSLFFSLILGFVFIFNYILPKARPTRYRYATFYSICFLENIICVVLYVTFSKEEDKQEDYFLILCIMSIVPFIVGVFFMVLYYLWFHPNLVSRRIYHDEEREKEMQIFSSSADPAAPVSTA